MRQQLLDLARQRDGVLEVDGAQGAAANLVFVSRADATLGGADLLGGGILAHGVEFAVQRQHQAGILGQYQQLGRHAETGGADLGDFL